MSPSMRVTTPRRASEKRLFSRPVVVPGGRGGFRSSNNDRRDRKSASPADRTKEDELLCRARSVIWYCPSWYCLPRRGSTTGSAGKRRFDRACWVFFGGRDRRIGLARPGNLRGMNGRGDGESS